MRMTIHSQASAGGPSRRTRLSGRTAGQAGRAADRLATDAWLPGCLLMDIVFMRSSIMVVVNRLRTRCTFAGRHAQVGAFGIHASEPFASGRRVHVGKTSRSDFE